VDIDMNNNKPHEYAHITIIEGDQGSGKSNTAVGMVVDDYKKDNTRRIYANFHLYGVRYMYLPLPVLLEYLNSDLIRDAWVLVDEGYIEGDKRDSMNSLAKTVTKFRNQIRKRKIDFVLIAPDSTELDFRWRKVATKRILCTYNPKTKRITMYIKKKGVTRTKVVSYYAPQYWKYFRTDEVREIPSGQISKALAGSV
jgi:hypothetical protein